MRRSLTSRAAPFLQVGAIALLSAAASIAVAQSPMTPARPTSERELDLLLRRRVSLTLHAAPAGEALAKLAAGTKLPMVLDRRIDRGKGIDLAAREASLLDVVAEVGAHVDARPVAWNGVLYVGPRGIGDRLVALSRERRRDVARLAPAERGPFRDVAPIAWKRLAEPRDVVADRLKQAGLRLENPDTIPHDLWDAGGVPPMQLADQLTLLLVQFDLAWAPADNGDAVEVAPLTSR
ncbi:MAG: hypothetical protein ACRCT8_02290 [Lacipirellulaceae bacterium]